MREKFWPTASAGLSVSVHFWCFSAVLASPSIISPQGGQLGSWYFMLMLCIGYFEIGQLLGVLYSRNKVWRSAAIALGMTLLGQACRFLLVW